mmetsp:Transcript_5725/g.9095  ORF Transcript_5725/g.9095 Transcript_5725/m.9095 type:complete len:270 (+) Transcript_5725:547-1356(+)
MELTFQMHLHALGGVALSLESTAHFADLHVQVRLPGLRRSLRLLLDLGRFCLGEVRGLSSENRFDILNLNLELLSLGQNFLMLFEITFLGLSLGGGVEEFVLDLEAVDLLVELVSLLVAQVCHASAVEANSVVLREATDVFDVLVLEQRGLLNLLPFNPVVSLDRVFRSDETLLDLGVHDRNHLRQVVQQNLLVTLLECLVIRVILELFLKELIVAVPARTLVVAGVGEEVIGAEAQQVVLAHFLLVEVITLVQADVQREVAVLTHELV